MLDLQIIWDLEDDPAGNYWHIVVEGHGVTQEEAEEVLLDPANPVVISRTTGSLMKFGWTSTGKHLAVTFEEVSADPGILYPTTAFPAPPPSSGKRKRRKRT